MLELHMNNFEQRKEAAAQFFKLASLRPTTSTRDLVGEITGLTKDELENGRPSSAESSIGLDILHRPTSGSSSLSTGTFLSMFDASSVGSYGSRPQSSKSGVSDDFDYYDDDDEDFASYIYRSAPNSAQSAREPRSEKLHSENFLRPATAICLMRVPDMSSLPYFTLPELSDSDLMEDFDRRNHIQKTISSQTSFNLDTEQTIDDIQIFKSVSRPRTGIVNNKSREEEFPLPNDISQSRNSQDSFSTLEKAAAPLLHRSSSVVGEAKELCVRIDSAPRSKKSSASTKPQLFKSSFPKTPLGSTRPKARSRDASVKTSRAPTRGKSGKPAKRNCDLCKKKLGLASSFACRCGDTFCGTHRYSDRHDCPYDYKAQGRRELTKANPLLVEEKLEKF